MRRANPEQIGASKETPFRASWGQLSTSRDPKKRQKGIEMEIHPLVQPGLYTELDIVNSLRVGQLTEPRVERGASRKCSQGLP